MWFDVRPTRPDEFGRQQAGRWHRIEATQQAFRRGVRVVDLEDAKRTQRKNQGEAEKSAIEQLKKR